MANGELGRDAVQSGRVIGADLPLGPVGAFPVRDFLEAFRGVAERHPDVRLALAGRRSQRGTFSVLNWIEKAGLSDRISFHPYYDICRDFPVRKADCTLWVGQDMPAEEITAEHFLRELERSGGSGQKTALFVTSFHPGKHEGNSALMRQWLRHLRGAGYRIHVLYYALDGASASADPRRREAFPHDLFVEVAVGTELVGVNQDGLNVHVDDWCGAELLAAAGELTARHAYDMVIANYAFMSAVFERVPSYAKRILLTHDRFSDRNRRMLAEGYPDAGWVSIDEAGEALACRRADVVVAVQEEEAAHLRRIAGNGPEVRVIAPIPPGEPRGPHRRGERLRVGYLGSSNWVNERNLGEYMKHWAASEALRTKAELVLGGGVCATLDRFVPSDLIGRVAPRMLGEVASLKTFFDACDVVINPERGGTGIKIKTLDAMAHGVPVLATKAGAVGIGSSSRFHSAEGFAELAGLTAELATAPDLLDAVAAETGASYAAYVERHRTGLSDLLGPTAGKARGRRRLPAGPPAVPDPVVPEEVRRTASDYHLEEFRRFCERVDPRGKRVIEIGSDFHLASARLFAANGAAEVVATNLGQWRSDEPLPPNVSFHVGDVADITEAGLEPESFDIVYGIAVLEHIPDLGRVVGAVQKLLRPDGIAYLQGCPLWPGALGHHVWLSAEAVAGHDPTALSGARKDMQVAYSFAEEAKNPIPHWAHLGSSPDELARLLVGRGVPAPHADAIVGYVYDRDGAMTGICSNFKGANEIVAAFREGFEVEALRDEYVDASSEHYQRARLHHSDSDLATLGLRLWLSPLAGPAGQATDPPRVSIVIPFYSVQDFIEACLRSVLAQAYEDFEVILVDDASPDDSRRIAERIAATDDRVRIVTHEVNRGLGPARNTGVRHASGDYILFLDSDDLLAGPEALGTLVAAAERSGAQVVAGSCERLMLDGSLIPFDRDFDARLGGRPGEALTGLDAFLGAMCMPGGGYLPMRAWGTLIDRRYYEALDHHFPAAEHEDLPHTPILYHDANRVHYEPGVIVHYRDRAEGLSRRPWPEEKVRRYATLWREMRLALERRGLGNQIGDSAVKFTEHLVWKLGANGLRPGAEAAALDVMETMLRDAGDAGNARLVNTLVDALRAPAFLGAAERARLPQLMTLLPPRLMLDYHRDRLARLGVSLPDRSAAMADRAGTVAHRVVATPAVPAAAPAAASATGSAEFRANQMLSDAILAEYEAHAAEEVKRFPSMLTTLDKAIYFHAARNFGFRGSIVDAGCFVGGTTTALVHGLRQNPKLPRDADRIRRLIRVYDLFEIDDDYILSHLEQNYPHRDFRSQKSFLPVFQENLAPHAELIEVRPGDVIARGYRDEEPIGLFGVDLCKALPVTDFVVREFFPRLLPGALVLQQDHVHEFHPHIHLSMLRLEDYFDRYVELKWGGTVAFTLRRSINTEAVRRHFGTDSSWFADVATNAPLLRRMVETALYDENRWVYLLTLGIYLAANGRQEEARAAYREARARFPQFEPSATTREMIGS